MPVKSCHTDGKPGYSWGDSGKCYTYTPGNEQSKKEAYDKAVRQGRAIQVNKEDYDNIMSIIEDIKDRLPHISGHYTPYVPSETVEVD